MNDESYAKQLENKLRKRINIASAIIIIALFIIFAVLRYTVGILTASVSIVLLFILYDFWIVRLIRDKLYVQPINNIITKDLNLTLFVEVCKNSPYLYTVYYCIIYPALVQGDYQTAVDFCTYALKADKKSNWRYYYISVLMEIYYMNRDREKLIILKDKFDELGQKNKKFPQRIYKTVDYYLNNDTENEKNYIKEIIDSEKSSHFLKIVYRLRLALLNYRNGCEDEAKADFTFVFENAPHLHHGKLAKEYLDAMERGEYYDHTLCADELLPQKNEEAEEIFGKPIKRNYISLIVPVLVLILIMYENIDYYFIKTPYSYTIPAESAEIVYGCSPEEFLNADLEVFDEIGDLSKNAEITADGDLLIKYTEYQAYRAKNSDWITSFKESDLLSFIDVSEDMRNITIYSIPEMEFYSMDKWLSIQDEIDSMMHKISVYHYLDQVSLDEKIISYQIIESSTGKPLYENSITVVSDSPANFITSFLIWAQ